MAFATQGNFSHDTILTIETLGSSQLDMYCGSLGVENVLQQAAAYLSAAGIHNTAFYKQWVGEGFKLCTLNDGSVFTLRFIDNEKPIHLHPARHVPNTMRIKANALKSVVCYMLGNINSSKLDVVALNTLRKQYLQLSPLSATTGKEEIEKVYSLLMQ